MAEGGSGFRGGGAAGRAPQHARVRGGTRVCAHRHACTRTYTHGHACTSMYTHTSTHITPLTHPDSPPLPGPGHPKAAPQPPAHPHPRSRIHPHSTQVPNQAGRSSKAGSLKFKLLLLWYINMER